MFHSKINLKGIRRKIDKEEDFENPREKEIPMPKRLWILAAIALLVGGVAAMSNAGGDMPAFPDIGEENLSALTAYLKTL